MEAKTLTALQGGGFLVQPSDPENTFTPEDFSEIQNMTEATCLEFLEKEVFHKFNDIYAKEESLMPSLLDKASELGLLGAAFPEKYGGLGEDFVTATVIIETMGGGHSFAVALAAHNGIGSLPILYFG